MKTSHITEETPIEATAATIKCMNEWTKSVVCDVSRRLLWIFDEWRRRWRLQPQTFAVADCQWLPLHNEDKKKHHTNRKECERKACPPIAITAHTHTLAVVEKCHGFLICEVLQGNQHNSVDVKGCANIFSMCKSSFNGVTLEKHCRNIEFRVHCRLMSCHKSNKIKPYCRCAFANCG